MFFFFILQILNVFFRSSTHVLPHVVSSTRVVHVQLVTTCTQQLVVLEDLQKIAKCACGVLWFSSWRLKMDLQGLALQ